MAWIFNSSNGTLAHNGEAIAEGYSGFEEGKNNPGAEREPGIGPIPRGMYSIGSVFDSEAHGPVVMHLSPEEGTETFGRGGFLIHGDSESHPGCASHGCIILPRSVRLQIVASDDKQLEVV